MFRTKSYVMGITLCLIAVISWGAMFPIMTHALVKMDPFTFTAVRFSLICLFLLLFLFLTEGIKAFQFEGHFFLLWLFGSIGFAGFGFFVFLGQRLAGPEGAFAASIIMATMPLLGLFANWVMQGIKPRLYSLMFVALSFVGVLLVITKGDMNIVYNLPQHAKADIYMLIGALCWVVYSISASYFPTWSPARYTALTILLGLITIYLVTTYLILSGYIVMPTMLAVQQTLPELSYMALIAGFIAFLCWNYGNKIITPVNGILFMAIVPIAAFIVAMFEGLMPTEVQVIGVLITVVALAMNNLYQRFSAKIAVHH